MPTFNKVVNTIGATVVSGLVILIIYGLLTDCPNTATYVYCGMPWSR